MLVCENGDDRERLENRGSRGAGESGRDVQRGVAIVGNGMCDAAHEGGGCTMYKWRWWRFCRCYACTAARMANFILRVSVGRHCEDLELGLTGTASAAG